MLTHLEVFDIYEFLVIRSRIDLTKEMNLVDTGVSRDDTPPNGIIKTASWANEAAG